jgi:predicted peroxiredoxin
MRVKVLTALTLALGVLAWAAAASASPGPLAGKRVLVHLKTGFKQDDNQPCVAFDVALAALKQGAKVEMFFDAAAVVDLKVWQGKPTSLAYEVPDKLKDILVAEYKTPVKKDFPKTYQELLRWLHKQGVEVTFNGTMAQLTSLSSGIHDVGQLEPIAKPLSLAEMLQHRARADIYFVY